MTNNDTGEKNDLNVIRLKRELKHFRMVMNSEIDCRLRFVSDIP
jgi:hypothetical protein